MRWRKLGVVYRPDGSSDWAYSHAMIPTPTVLNERVLRIYLSFRDRDNVGRAGYVDVNRADPRQVVGVSARPVLDIGLPGTFDENGILPTCVLNIGQNTKYMYYVGFELGTKIRYRLLTGLAVSTDGGETFQRVRKTPILERSDEELYFRCGPHVIRDAAIFKMWYVAGSDWTLVSGKSMPVYVLKYLESEDGINWADCGILSLDISDPDEHGFGRPYVIKEGDQYRMHYSIRKRSVATYRLGYAESQDGIHWTRRDAELGLDVSPSGWDSEAVMYSAEIKVGDRTYLFYNGNNFGETGFGVAVLEE